MDVSDIYIAARNTLTTSVTRASTTIAGAMLVQQELVDKLEIKDMGELTYILGIHFNGRTGNISLLQQGYPEHLIEQSGIENSNPKSIPLPAGIQLVGKLRLLKGNGDR